MTVRRRRWPAAAAILGRLLALALLLALPLGAPARADHGQWEERQVWIEPVTETRTRAVAGHWDERQRWIPGYTIRRLVTETRPVDIEYQAFVPQGHWETVRVWVVAYEQVCTQVWQWYQQCSNFWTNCQLVYGPQEQCERVDVSHWEESPTWVNTSYWETRTRIEMREFETTIEEEFPGHWESYQVWIPARIETYQHTLVEGHWETELIWVLLEHDLDPEPVGEPGLEEPGCVPSGIYKVVDNYVGTHQWTDSNGVVHYETTTSGANNPWWAVRLGSISKGVSSRYDSQAFNGRGIGADGKLLAGRFYRNYLPDGQCYRAVSVVFFQDDTVQTGDLDDQDLIGNPAEPTATPTETPAEQAVPPTANQPTENPNDEVPGDDPGPDGTPTPIDPGTDPDQIGGTPTPIDPGTDPDQTGGPSTPSPEDPGSGDPPLAPAGGFDFAVVVEGTTHRPGPGRPAIELLRGAPVAVYLVPRLQAPAGTPGARVHFTGWRFVAGPNDHPQGPRAGERFSPLQPLRLRIDNLPHNPQLAIQISLQATVRVIGSGGETEEFDLPVVLAATIFYQAIT